MAMSDPIADMLTRIRNAGKAKYGVWNRVFRAFVDLMAVRWMKKRSINYHAREL